MSFFKNLILGVAFMVDLVLFCFEGVVKLHLDDCYVGLVSRVVKLLMFLKDLCLKLEDCWS